MTVGVRKEYGTPPANYVFRLDAADDCSAVVMAYSGIDNNILADQTSGAENDSSTSSPLSMTPGGFTTNYICDLAYTATADWTSTGSKSYAAPATYTEAEDQDPGGFPSHTGGYKDNVAAGAVADPTIVATKSGASGGWMASHIALARVVADQEGFRGRNDDGSESTATWIAAQDTDFNATLDTNFRLRFLLNGLQDPPSTAYQVEYRKSGETRFHPVPVGSSTPTTPSVRSTRSGSQHKTITQSITRHHAQLPDDIEDGDLIIAHFGTDGAVTINWDNTTVGTWTTLDETNNGTANDMTVRAILADGTESGKWLYISTDSSEMAWCRFYVIKNHGVSTIATDIAVGTAATGSSTTPDPPNVSHSFGTGDETLYMAFIGVNSNKTISGYPSGYSDNQNSDVGISTSHTTIASCSKAAASSSDNPGTFTLSGTDTWVALTIAIKPGAGGTNRCYIATSGNITAGGEATTAQLTAPSGKTSGSDFDTGRMWDDENGSDSIDITDLDYTELEWCMHFPTGGAVAADVYEFRVREAGSFSVTPQVTIVAGGAGATIMNQFQGSNLGADMYNGTIQ